MFNKLDSPEQRCIISLIVPIQCKMLWDTCTNRETTHSKLFPISALRLWESLSVGLFMIYGKKGKRGAMHVFLRRSQKKQQPLNRQKKKQQKKLSPPPSVKKKPCDRLLPNVGVPKILPDRKFPILSRVLKSCSHPNAVTVILLTLIAFLHPCSLSFILSLCPSLPENTVCYQQYIAALCWFTADNMLTSSWDYVLLGGDCW